MEMRTVNCEAVVKQFCFEKLNMPEIAVRAIVFDRVHRIGRVEKLKPCGICPVHRYSERKKVQETWYEKNDVLKEANLAVRPQLPLVRENR